MSYNPAIVVSTTNPLPVTLTTPAPYNPQAQVKDTNPKPVQIIT